MAASLTLLLLVSLQKPRNGKGRKQQVANRKRWLWIPGRQHLESHLICPRLICPHLLFPHLLCPHLMRPNIMHPHKMCPHLMRPHIMHPRKMCPHLLCPHLMRPHIMHPRKMCPHLMCPRLVCLHLMCLCRFHQTAACLTGIRLSLLSPIGPARPRSLLPQLILPLPRLLHLSMAISGILACLLTTMRSLCSLPTFKNAMVAVQYFPKDPEVLLLIFALSMLIRGL